MDVNRLVSLKLTGLLIHVLFIERKTFHPAQPHLPSLAKKKKEKEIEKKGEEEIEKKGKKEEKEKKDRKKGEKKRKRKEEKIRMGVGKIFEWVEELSKSWKQRTKIQNKMQNWMGYLFVLFSKRKNLCLLIQPAFFSFTRPFILFFLSPFVFFFPLFFFIFLLFFSFFLQPSCHRMNQLVRKNAFNHSLFFFFSINHSIPNYSFLFSSSFFSSSLFHASITFWRGRICRPGDCFFSFVFQESELKSESKTN